MADRSVLVRLIADNRGFDSAMSSSSKRVKEVGTEATLAGDAATQAFSRIRTAAVSLIGFGVAKSGQDIINLKQQAGIAFTAITGSAEQANAAIGQIYQWDQTVPIPFQNALGSAQKLAAFGVDMKDIIPTLQAIADATGAIGDASKFDQIALAIGQIQTKGKLSAEEMLQLAEAGLPAWQILAETLNTTVADAQKQVTKGTIDADTAIAALRDGIERKFPGAAQNLKDTTLGAFNGVVAGIRNAGESMLSPLQGVEKQGAQTAKTLIEAFGSGVGATFQGLVPIIGGVTSTLSAVGVVSHGIPPEVSAIGIAMLATHLASKQLASGGDTLALRWMYATDVFRGFGEEMKVQQALATMQGESLSRVGAGATVLGMRFGQLGTAAKGLGTKLLGAFGGPLGVAIIGATALMSAWGAAQQRTQQQEAEHQAQLAALKDTLDSVTGAFTAATVASIGKDWVDSGDIDKMKQLGVNTDLAIAAAAKGGPSMVAFKDSVKSLAMQTFQSSDYWKKWGADFEAAGMTADSVLENILANGDAVTKGGVFDALGTSADLQQVRNDLSGLTDVYDAVAGKQADVAAGGKMTQDAFVATAGAVAEMAGVSRDKLLPALDKAKQSGQSVESALAEVGITGDTAAQIISNLSGYVTQGAGDFHVMAGAASNLGSTLSSAGDGADDFATRLNELRKQGGAAIADLVSQAAALRNSVQGSITSFIDPIGAWDAATTAVNPTKSGGGGGRKKSTKTPAELAAEAALKAGKIQAEGTKKSAKAEQDAAVKAADKIRDAVKARADADLKATRAAEKNARDRAAAAKKEADELKRIADDAAKRATDAQSRLEAAQFAKRAADIALDAARAGLASAKTPEERASWERAVATALADQVTASSNLAGATRDASQATQDATKAKSDSEGATKRQEKAEGDYQTAQDKTAQVSETTSARKSAADDAYTKAKEKADTRYQKSVDAVNSKLDALTTAQDNARTSAQDMATGAAGAVSGMVAKITPSFQDWMTQLAQQKKAQDTWAQNLLDLSQKLPPDVTKYLAGLGPGAAGMIAAMNTQSVAELRKAVPLLRAATPEWTDAITNTILAGIPGVNEAFAQLSQGAQQSLINELMAGKDSPANILKRYGIAMKTASDGSPIYIKINADLDPATKQVNGWLSNIGAATIPLINNRSYGRFASGGMVGDGWFLTGEQGPEFGLKQGNSVRMFSNPESQRMIPAPAPSGPSITIVQNNVINYPQGTPPAVATNRELASAAAFGGLG